MTQEEFNEMLKEAIDKDIIHIVEFDGHRYYKTTMYELYHD